jgi:hypothetical protein
MGELPGTVVPWAARGSVFSQPGLARPVDRATPDDLDRLRASHERHTAAGWEEGQYDVITLGENRESQAPPWITTSAPLWPPQNGYEPRQGELDHELALARRVQVELGHLPFAR